MVILDTEKDMDNVEQIRLTSCPLQLYGEGAESATNRASDSRLIEPANSYGTEQTNGCRIEIEIRIVKSI